MGERGAGHNIHRVCWPLAMHFGAPLEPQRYVFSGPSSRLANVCHLQICRSLPDHFVKLARKSVFPQPLQVSTPPPTTPYAPATTWFPIDAHSRSPVDASNPPHALGGIWSRLVNSHPLQHSSATLGRCRKECARGPEALCVVLALSLITGLWTEELYGASIRLCFPSPP